MQETFDLHPLLYLKVVCSAGEGFAAMAVVKKKVVVKRKGSV
jgi:hypothetical protein